LDLFGRRWWTMLHPMVGWFAWAALVDDAASDGWLVRLGSAGGRCGIRWLVGPLGQRWWTMRHPMVGWFAWAALVDNADPDGWLARPTTLVDDADPMVGWSAWAALVDDAASDGWLRDIAGGPCGIRRSTIPEPRKIRRVGAAERGTRRFPGFQDHYSIRKCWSGRR
jgi:hypothetical protein